MANIESLVRLVHSMRCAQKDYFKTRSKESFELSKQLESQVDDIIGRGVKYYDKQKILNERIDAMADTLGLERVKQSDQK